MIVSSNYRSLRALIVLIKTAWLPTFVVIGMIYFLFRPYPTPVGITVDAKPAVELKKEVTTPLVIDFVKVYQPSVKKKLGLSAVIQQDVTKHVVASTRVSADDRPHTVTTVLDSSTREFFSYDRVDPSPWISVNTKTHIGAYYGVKNLTQPVVRMQIQQEILRIKAIHIEGIAAMDVGAVGKPDTFIGIGGRISF